MKSVIAACTIFLLTAFSASAGSSPPGPDLRCLLVGMRLSTVTDPQQKSAGLMLTSYFYARLEQTATKELEDDLAKEAFDMSPSDFKFELGRCSGILKEKGQVIKALGADLMRRRQNADAQASPESQSTEK
jgi:hypothetical protein